jgi:hypothetical protein
VLASLLAAILLTSSGAQSDDALCQVTDNRGIGGAQEQLRALNPPEEASTFFVTNASAIFVVVRPLRLIRN